MNLFTIHELKTDPDSFDEIDMGIKLTTIRCNDRGYAVSDYVVLRRTKHTGDEMKGDFEVMPKLLEYTGKALMCKITHVQMSPGLIAGWAVLSLDIMDRFPSNPGARYLQSAIDNSSLLADKKTI